MISKNTTIADLKKWSRLYEAAKYNAANHSCEDPSVLNEDEHLDYMFVFGETSQGIDFWWAVTEGRFDEAEIMRPYLFEDKNGVKNT